MATKRKDEGVPEEPRKDASGRELFPWEVDPGKQATPLSSEAADGDTAAGGAQADTVEGGDR